MGAIGTGNTEGMLTSAEADRLNDARGILRLHTIMYSIELSLHVKGAAFEYYCKIEHVIFF